MTTKPRRESYRVTITRPDTVLVRDVRLRLAVALQEYNIPAEVELIQKRPQSWYKRLFNG